MEPQGRDKVVVQSIPARVPRKIVAIYGDVRKPGQYPYAANITVKDLIFAAGSLLESAYLDEAELASHEIECDSGSPVSYRTVDLRRAMSGDPAHNVTLRPCDRLSIRRMPEWREERFVEVGGEVKLPGRYVVNRGERLSSVIERAGGYNENAYLRGALFTRERVRQLQQRELDDMIKRLERAILAASVIQSSSPLSQEECVEKEVEVEQRQNFIESLKKLKVTGRMVVRLAHLRLLKGSEYDIVLEDGDTLTIPMKNSVVNVIGMVMSPGSYIYSEGLDYKKYIKMAGGFLRFADEDNVFIIKANGSVRKLSRGFFHWNTTRSRWEVSAFAEEIEEIEPGDTIVAPEKLGHIVWLREVKDLTQILMQIAAITGVVVRPF
ncbi:MAG: SLBB domain-containing protein [Thermodesulfobacteriota bacterium]